MQIIEILKYLMFSSRLIVSYLSLIDSLFVINEKMAKASFFDALLLAFLAFLYLLCW